MSVQIKTARINALLESIKKFDNKPVLANQLLIATNKELMTHYKLSNTRQMCRVIQLINLQNKQKLIKTHRIIKKVDGATVTYTYYQKIKDDKPCL